MKISETHGEFVADDEHIGFVHTEMDSANYSTAFRREYGNAISQRNSAHCVEYLGFRNPSDALMTLDNMYIETKFPIYKINKIYMCYYKNILVYNSQTNSTYYKLFLVKQDISHLILENTVRNTLSADWTKYPDEISSIEDMGKYKVLTLGYDIGSTTITGWGTKYSYIKDLLGWMNETKTYLENIVDFIDMNSLYGEQTTQVFSGGEVPVGNVGWRDSIVSPAAGKLEGSTSNNIATKLKTIFFQIDYIGMYSGAVVHTKDETDDDDLETSDNCSSALSILEVDGLFEKEKANRLANKTFSFSGRYDDYQQMDNTVANGGFNNKLGTIYSYDNNETGIIIYHREYQIYDDCVLCNFVGSYDYVMKNYYTTVFAKYRTYSYAGYGESINRAENDRYNVVLSTGQLYYETVADTLFRNFDVVSAFLTTNISASLNFVFDKQINGAYIVFYGKDANDDEVITEYFADVNQFVCGNSLCFNVKTYSNLTNGVYISNINCFDHDNNNQQTNYIGSAQEWYVMPFESESDGFLERIGFYFGHFNNLYDANETNDETVKDNAIVFNNIENFDTSDSDNVDNLFRPLFNLPLKTIEPSFYFGNTYNICKDNKEIIDFTLQYEMINLNKTELLYSEWLMKLNSFGNYLKLENDKSVANLAANVVNFKIYFGTVKFNHGTNLRGNLVQGIVIRIKDEDILDLEYGNLCQVNNSVPYKARITFSDTGYDEYETYIYLQKINYISEQEIRIDGEVIVTRTSYKKIPFYKPKTIKYFQQKRTFYFYKLDYVAETDKTDYYCHVAALSNTEDENLSDLIYQFSSCRFFPTEETGWNANLVLANSEIQTSSFVTNFDPYEYEKTMYILVSKEPMEESLIYSQYKLDNLPNKFIVCDSTVPSVFALSNEGEKISVNTTDLKTELANIYANANSQDYRNYKSIQYWYYDREENGGDGYLHFVFGINATPNDEDPTIYISTIKRRNKKVYNVLHREVGTVMNFADQNNIENYGKQLYVPNDNEEE